MRTYLLSGGETKQAGLRDAGCTDVRWEFSNVHKTGQIRFFPKAAVR